MVDLPPGKIHLQLAMSSGGDSSDLLTMCGICLVVELVGGSLLSPVCILPYDRTVWQRLIPNEKGGGVLVADPVFHLAAGPLLFIW